MQTKTVEKTCTLTRTVNKVAGKTGTRINQNTGKGRQNSIWNRTHTGPSPQPKA